MPLVSSKLQCENMKMTYHLDVVSETARAAQFKLTFKTGEVVLAHNLVQMKQRMVHEILVTFGAVVMGIGTRLVAAHRIDGFKVVTA